MNELKLIIYLPNYLRSNHLSLRLTAGPVLSTHTVDSY